MLIKAARESYREEMKEVVKATSLVFENEAAPVYEKLLQDKYGAELCAMSKKAMAVEPDDITHDRFLPTPTWAQQKNMGEAVKQLTEVGIIRSDGELSDLLQQGRHVVHVLRLQTAPERRPQTLPHHIHTTAAPNKPSPRLHPRQRPSYMMSKASSHLCHTLTHTPAQPKNTPVLYMSHARILSHHIPAA